MNKKLSVEDLKAQNEELTYRLEEAEQMIEAIKAGEVDAFAMVRNDQPEIFTLQSVDYGYRALVENFNEGALTLTENGLIVYTNTYFYEFIDAPYEDVIGKAVFSFIDISSTDTFQDLFRKGCEGQSKGEINLIYNGKTYPVYVSLASLYPTLDTIGMIVTDLSEKKQQQELLIKQNETLKKAEENINAKAEELEVKNVELLKSNKELESFTYISSHDLQEPLRKIQIYASRINEKEVNNLSNDGKNMFERIESAAERMQLLINDLLSYSRTNNADLNLELTYLKQIVDEVLEELKEEISEKKAIIETDGLGYANVIAFQFRQLLLNLIGNSLKFCRPGITPIIRIEFSFISSYPAFGGGAACHISISDNGIGFDPQYADKIFELFQRLHIRETYRGTGIGLSIVKKIVDNHNGIIKASSTLGNGATFDIYLPQKLHKE